MNKFYLLTSFICGAVVMVLEIIGTRLLSPFFGSGLFVWSSSIIVAMLGLSVGYSIGGRMADSKKNKLADSLYAVILFSSIITLLSPEMSRIIYYFYEFVDIKISTFLSSFILLFIPLVALGMVSPIVLKLISKDYNQVGKDLGFIYAISTIGSLFGALLAGFVLLQFMGANDVFFYSALILALLSIGYYSYHKKFIFILILLPFVFFYSNENKPLIESKDFSINMVAKKDTFYGRVDVVDINSKSDTTHNQRFMLLDGMPQGAIDKSSNKSIFLYHYYIESLVKSLNVKEEKQDLLFVGVGAGLMPKNLSKNYNVTSVDINPAVVEFAQKYFNLDQDVTVADGRVFLQQNNSLYDSIIFDVFAGETIPNHLLTAEFMKLLKLRLHSDGYVFFNIVGNPYDGMESKSIISTINSSFEYIKVLPLIENNTHTINYVVVASNTPILLNRDKLFREIESRVAFNPYLVNKFRIDGIPIWDDMSKFKGGDILTDDLNKIDFYSIDEKKEIRAKLSNFLLTLN